MSTGCQKDRKSGGQTSGQTDRRTDRQTDRKTETFQLSYQNKSFSECPQNVEASVRQEGRYTERQAGRQRDRITVWQIAGQLKSPLLFNVTIQTNVSRFAINYNCN